MNDRPDTVRTTRFRDPPEKCGEWLTLLRNGSIEVELYDHSEIAQACYGSDLAYILTLAYPAVCQLMELIRPDDYEPNFSGVSPYDLFLISQRFECYILFKEFCDFNEIPYSLVFERNA